MSEEYLRFPRERTENKIVEGIMAAKILTWMTNIKPQIHNHSKNHTGKHLRIYYIDIYTTNRTKNKKMLKTR